MSCDHLEVLSLAQAGHWEEAHSIVQKHGDELSCQIHGYLHRVEGDLSNARYWYGRGHCPLPTNTLDEEWLRLQTLAAAAA
ncbi:MAG: hypothetical protein LBE30_13470 [Comamonas sp.]|jgi:hypothetical protein|nr:hypothetical protein [Comamonas sp.]